MAIDMKAFSELTDIEKQLKIAEENLREHGTLTVPKEVAYTMMEKRCPHCTKTKKVIPDFGLSMHPDGKARPTGWCRKCRSEDALLKQQHPELRNVKLKTPRYPTAFIHAMTPEQRKIYIMLYNDIAETLDQPTLRVG